MLKCGTGFSVCLCDYALESDEFLVFISNFVFHQHSPGIACFAIKCRFLDFQGEVGGCIFHNVAEMQNISQIEKKQNIHLMFSYWVYPGFGENFIIFIWWPALGSWFFKYTVAYSTNVMRYEQRWQKMANPTTLLRKLKYSWKCFASNRHIT